MKCLKGEKEASKNQSHREEYSGAFRYITLKDQSTSYRLSSDPSSLFPLFSLRSSLKILQRLCSIILSILMNSFFTPRMSQEISLLWSFFFDKLFLCFSSIFLVAPLGFPWDFPTIAPWCSYKVPVLFFHFPRGPPRIFYDFPRISLWCSSEFPSLDLGPPEDFPSDLLPDWSVEISPTWTKSLGFRVFRV